LSLAYGGCDCVWLTADAARLTQVFLNTLDNSIKHSAPGEAIHIEVKCLEGDNLDSELMGDALPSRKTGTPPTNAKGSIEPESGTSYWATPHFPEASTSRATDTRLERGFVQIDIIDAGAGFSESDLPHVFQRLYRGDTSRYRQQTGSDASQALGRISGSGLGLAIVQQIVQAHSGTIKARNHPETGGAWLQIKLPI
jgi:two-component system phosphate regulon sensor histidine kinase PhoR